MNEILTDPLDTLPLDLIKLEDGATVTVTKYIPFEEYDTLWEMVETGFRDLNRKSYEKQDMTKDELYSDLGSKEVLKYTSRDSSGALTGLLTVHIGLGDITWTDTSKLRETQKEIDQNAQPYYVGTLVVPVDLRGTTTAQNLIKGALIHFQQVNRAKNHNSLVFFDCAEANYPWLAQFIAGVGSPSEDFPELQTNVEELYTDSWVQIGESVEYVHDAYGDIPGEILDRQHYYAISVLDPDHT